MKISVGRNDDGWTAASIVRIRPQTKEEGEALREIVERNRPVAPRDFLPFVMADLYRAGFHLEWEEP